MNGTRDSAEDQSIRDLILGVHDKLDTLLASYRRVLRDRLKDRDTVQRHDRRIEQLELQVSMLTASSPGMKSWRPNVADRCTSEHAALEIAELNIEDEIDL